MKYENWFGFLSFLFFFLVPLSQCSKKYWNSGIWTIPTVVLMLIFKTSFMGNQFSTELSCFPPAVTPVAALHFTCWSRKAAWQLSAFIAYIESLSFSFLPPLQNLLRIEKIHVIMNFLPVVLNQLFWVLVQNRDDEVTTAVTRYLDNSCVMYRIHSGAQKEMLVQS